MRISSGIDRNRPAFNSMLQAANEHQFDVVLANNPVFTVITRLVEKYLHGKFAALRNRFIAVVDHVDTSTANKMSPDQIVVSSAVI